MRVRVLFVCLGNICRSPLAEAVFRRLAREAGLEQAFVVDSAGTGGFHVGEPPDPMTLRTATRHGLHLERRARQLRAEELDEWDYVVVMDDANRRAVERLGPARARVVKLRDFDPAGPGDVPDPYGMGEAYFEEVYAVIRRSCEGLLRELARLHGPATGTP